jgi:hypothetical protein
MSRLEVPIIGKMLWSTGDVALRADLELRLKDSSGTWKGHTFLVDTGSELTTMGAHEAKQLGLPMPLQVSPGAIHAQTGLPFRSGYLQFQIVGMDLTEYVTPCLFLGDPNIPPNLSPQATAPRRLLDQLRFSMDRDPAAGAMYGSLVVEKK